MALSPAHEAGRLSETAGRYLEAIYYIAHEGELARPGGLADWLGVSRPTVTVTLQRLARDGWVEVAGDRSITLTAGGEAAASDLVRRHRILERWLVDVLGLDWAAGDREASLLVHGVSDEVVDRLDAAPRAPPDLSPRQPNPRARGGRRPTWSASTGCPPVRRRDGGADLGGRRARGATAAAPAPRAGGDPGSHGEVAAPGPGARRRRVRGEGDRRAGPRGGPGGLG